MTGRRNGSVRVAVLRVARHGPHLSVGQIAAVVGCHRSTVRKHLRGLRRGGLVLRRTAERVAAAAAADVDGPMLARLAGDAAWEVRGAVAGNPSSPPQMLARFAGEPDRRVRRTAARNANCPPRMLARLAGDVDRFVRRDAASNPRSPVRMLARLAGDADSDVRYAVAVSAGTPPVVLARLAADGDAYVRWEATHNPSVADSGAILDG